MSNESIERFDQSGLKAACERGLKIGRTRQEFDLQLLLDMFTRIEELETDAANHQRIVKELEAQIPKACDECAGTGQIGIGCAIDKPLLMQDCPVCRGRGHLNGPKGLRPHCGNCGLCNDPNCLCRCHRRTAPSLSDAIQPEEIAHKLVSQFYDGERPPTRFSAYGSILSALRNERERCAKVAEAHSGHGEWCGSAADDCQPLTVKAIAKAIREGR